MLSQASINKLGNIFIPDYPFSLEQDTKDVLKKLDRLVFRLQARISVIEKRKINILRQAAWKAGFAAKKLKDLRSTPGNTFLEHETSNKYAFAQAQDVVSRIPPEVAYLCACEHALNKKDDSCGWVRGEPRSEGFDELGILSGSSGVEYSCVICGKNIGRVELVHS